MEKQTKSKIISPLTGQPIENSTQAREAIREINQARGKFLASHRQNEQLITEFVCQLNTNFDIDKQKGKQNKEYFLKLYKRIDRKKVHKDLSANSHKLLNLFIDYLDYKDNSVMIDDKYPSQREMVEEFSISINTIKKSMKELKDCLIILTERHGKQTKTYINPYWVTDGDQLPKHIYDMFDEKIKEKFS